MATSVIIEKLKENSLLFFAHYMKYIVIFAGSRDEYQLPLALLKSDRLKHLVTDDIILRSKYRKLFPKEMIRVPFWALFLQIMTKLFPKYGNAIREKRDAYLSKIAGRLSEKEKCPIIAYSGYASMAFPYTAISPKIIFQYHPHPLSNLKIYEREIEKHPEIAEAFKQQESELRMNEADKDFALNEVKLADYYMVASSFTCDTVVENGADPSKVLICPYGVNVSNYSYSRRKIDNHTCITFAFVGSYTFRKGIYYLVEAAKILQLEGYNFKIEMTGRADEENVQYINSFNLNIVTHYNMSHEEKVEMLHRSHVFLFPSLCEGFAFSVVEAMATGLPVISTTRTIARDIVKDKEEGFVVEPSDSLALANAMKYFIETPQEVMRMGQNACERVRNLNWEDFHNKINTFLDTLE